MKFLLSDHVSVFILIHWPEKCPSGAAVFFSSAEDNISGKSSNEVIDRETFASGAGFFFIFTEDNIFKKTSFAVISLWTKLTVKCWACRLIIWTTADSFGEFSKRCKLRVNYKNAREYWKKFGVCMPSSNVLFFKLGPISCMCLCCNYSAQKKCFPTPWVCL